MITKYLLFAENNQMYYTDDLNQKFYKNLGIGIYVSTNITLFKDNVFKIKFMYGNSINSITLNKEIINIFLDLYLNEKISKQIKSKLVGDNINLSFLYKELHDMNLLVDYMFTKHFMKFLAYHKVDYLIYNENILVLNKKIINNLGKYSPV